MQHPDDRARRTAAFWSGLRRVGRWLLFVVLLPAQLWLLLLGGGRLPDHPRWPCLRRVGRWALLLTFLPALLLIAFLPVAWWFGCTGNEGTGLRCAQAPGLNEAATSIMFAGTWGLLLSAAAGLLLFALGLVFCLVRHRTRRPL